MTFDPETRITITDIRRAGHCPSGARAWLETHGFDFRAFLRDGASAGALIEADEGDTALAVVRFKMERGDG